MLSGGSGDGSCSASTSMPSPPDANSLKENEEYVEVRRLRELCWVSTVPAQRLVAGLASVDGPECAPRRALQRTLPAPAMLGIDSAQGRPASGTRISPLSRHYETLALGFMLPVEHRSRDARTLDATEGKNSPRGSAGMCACD